MPAPPSLGEGLPERISRLVAEGESYEVEFKGESRAPLNDRDLVEAVVYLRMRQPSKSCVALMWKSMTSWHIRCCGWRRRCSIDSGLGTARKTRISVCCG